MIENQELPVVSLQGLWAAALLVALPPDVREGSLARRRPHDPDRCCSAGTNNTSMAFDPRQLSILEVAGVATIIVSAVRSLVSCIPSCDGPPL